MKDITLFKHDGDLFFKTISRKEDVTFDCDGIIIDADEKECRRTIEFIKSKDKKIAIAVVGRDDEFNRRALETLKINYLISPELTEQKDTLKQRSSGMNDFMAKLAIDKKIIIVEGLNFIIQQKDRKTRAMLLSRIIQNIKICRKAGCDIKFASFAKNEDEIMEEKDKQSIGFSLGMSSQQVKKCCEY